MLKSLLVLLVVSPAMSAEPGPQPANGQLVLEQEGQPLRVRFVGNKTAGYDVVFERRASGGWESGAGFPAGQAWSVYTDWRDSWYAGPHHIKVQ